MTKVPIIFFLFLISFAASGQNVDSLGISRNDILNRDESKYLNDSFKNKRGDFNFKGKKIAFFVGSSNYKRWNKQDYFDSVKGALQNNTTMQHQLLVLDADQRVRSGGYDAFVIAWSKVLVGDDEKERLIKKLNGMRN